MFNETSAVQFMIGCLVLEDWPLHGFILYSVWNSSAEPAEQVFIIQGQKFKCLNSKLHG